MSMYLRLATYEDAELLLRWANEPLVRQNSFNTHIISREEHFAWFNEVLCSSNIQIFILCDHCPVGTVRIKYVGKNAEISYSVSSDYRGNGYGTKIIQLAEIEVLKNHDIECIFAEVKDENFASCRIFRKLCYVETQFDGYL